MIHFLKFYFLPISSGLLIGFSYIPFPPWALFFGFVPLWSFCLRHSHQLKSILIGGWLCQFFITLVGFSWVAYTISHFGQMHWLLGVVGFLLFSSVAHLHIPIALGVWYALTRLSFFKNKFSSWILLPTLSAFFFSLLPMLFRWNLGYPWLWIKLPAYQTAEIWGFEFLGTLTFFFQLVFLSLIHKNLFKKVFPIGLTAFIFLNLWGYFLIQKRSSFENKARILMVQHNIGNYVHSQESFQKLFRDTLNRLKNMTTTTLDSQTVDFIVWPEGAYPYPVSHTKTPLRTQYLQKIVREEFKAPLVTGGHTYTPEGHSTNSMFFLNEHGEFSTHRYDKNYLLAFGEYMPGEKWFPFLREFFLGSRRRLISGNEIPALRKVDSLQLGVQICYEGLQVEFSRKAVESGAQILLNVTNDSWFGKWLEPYQHLYLTLGRVIETRTPMVRLSTVGYSTAITSLGEILTLSPLHEPWAEIVELPYAQQPQKTIFVRWGHWIQSLFLLSIFTILILMNIFFKKPFKNLK